MMYIMKKLIPIIAIFAVTIFGVGLFTNDALAAKTLTYSGSGYTEHSANDGSVSGSIVSTITEDIFQDTDTDNILDVGSEVTVGNVPSGLTSQISL